MLFSRFLALGLATIFIGSARASPPATKNVTTPLGTYSGVYIPTFNTYQFLGIPFAEPPIGPLRFKRPVALKPGNNVPQTFIAGPSCMQSALSPISEDCLKLYIVTPASIKPNQKLPVLIWTHGGGQTSGGIIANNGTFLVQRSVAMGQPIIYVAANYRLNSFGFLASKELGEQGNINLGLRDQRLALKWLQIAISSFGGDPKRVTIFGESAGARSVAMQMLGNGGKPDGLFRGAIMESGSPSAFPYLPPAGREPIYDQILARTSCSSLNCLHALPAANLSSATTAFLSSGLYGVFPYGPVLDPDFASELPSNLVRAGKVANVPFISGNNNDEGTLFASRTLQTEADLDTYLSDNFAPPGKTLPSGFLTKIRSAYPNDPSKGSPFGTGNQTFGLPPIYKQAAAIYGDISYQSSRRDFLRSVPNNSKTWSYLFDEKGLATPDLGVAHSFEIAFVFGNVAVDSTRSAGQRALSVTMMSYWIAFANALDPSYKGVPEWPKYHTRALGATQYFQSGNVSTITDDYREKGMDLNNENRKLLNH